jgi:multiple sugar transport system ATP-binding protein
MVEVSLERLTKVFPGGITAVRDVTLHVATGEWLVLVGPSGCGKSTLLRLIAGLETPTAGVVRLGGLPVNDWPPRRRNLAMLTQRPAVLPHLSVQENLAFALHLARLPEIECQRRVLETAELLGLGDLLPRRAIELSGGEQQRVALGRSLARRTPLLLLDEPFAALDVELKLELRSELHLLQRRLQTTMISVTHDPQEALALGDRVAVLAQGSVEQVDRPELLQREPATTRVARLANWPPWNLLAGRIARPGEEWVFTTGETTWPLPGPLGGVSEGQPVILGIAPRHVQLGGLAETGRLPTMIVERVERWQAEEWLAILRPADGSHPSLTAWIDGPTPAMGQRVAVGMEWSQARWFSAGGQSLREAV